MEDLTDKQGGFYREIGIFLRPATGSGLGRVPCGERLFGEPDRNIAPLAQRFVIFGPVGHFVTRFFNLVTAALIVFVRPGCFRASIRWTRKSVGNSGFECRVGVGGERPEGLWGIRMWPRVKI